MKTTLFSILSVIIVFKTTLAYADCYAVIEERIGYISEGVPFILQPKESHYNFAQEVIERLSRIKNPMGFYIPQEGFNVPDVDGFVKNIEFRTGGSDCDFQKSLGIIDYREFHLSHKGLTLEIIGPDIKGYDVTNIYLYILEETR